MLCPCLRVGFSSESSSRLISTISFVPSLVNSKLIMLKLKSMLLAGRSVWWYWTDCKGWSDWSMSALVDYWTATEEAVDVYMHRKERGGGWGNWRKGEDGLCQEWSAIPIRSSFLIEKFTWFHTISLWSFMDMEHVRLQSSRLQSD